MSPPKTLTLGFVLIILIGTLLLMLPISTISGESTPFIDAFFTATSATCVTGLVIMDTGTHFSTFGQMVMITLVQIGGLGFMTMATLIALVMRKRISLRERLILQESMKQNSMDGIVRLIRKVLIYALFIELTGAILLTIRWSVDMPFAKALYFGFFHSISMFNNAGFDLFGSIHTPFNSLAAYVHDPAVNLIVILLIVLGGIGFIVIADLLEYPKKKKFTLHTKVVLSASAVLIVISTIIIFIFEYSNPLTLEPLNLAHKSLGSLFQSISPRSGGVSTLDVADMRQATQFFIVILMFIGAAPGSAGGGIKITTFVILIGAVVAMVRGKETIVFFRRSLSKDRVNKAITMTLLALMLIIFVSMVLSTTEDHQFLVILFEVTSAFGTTGMSMGLTQDLTTFGKVMISIMMFLGRLGPLTLAYALTSKPEKELIKYPEDKIIIG
ncbi:TrkH family potassium uptake protein [Paenibacillus oenotherae]|uniref:TrkH family potassium uptake protein n=1 Tax=Paenibacillus oenotherae TaxID=1435645 RepID=A0ABS7DB64_9BACL|nr:TrkH family potassium uptake protein [Paenibacillus oenotherae]MBW7477136.1 TrkH family potassium uptake protein [Paenibacillus oenotherae]